MTVALVARAVSAWGRISPAHRVGPSGLLDLERQVLRQHRLEVQHRWVNVNGCPKQVTVTAYAADGTVERTVDGASEDEGRFIALPVQPLAVAGPAGSATTSACPQPEPTGS